METANLNDWFIKGNWKKFDLKQKEINKWRSSKDFPQLQWAMPSPKIIRITDAVSSKNMKIRVRFFAGVTTFDGTSLGIIEHNQEYKIPHLKIAMKPEDFWLQFLKFGFNKFQKAYIEKTEKTNLFGTRLPLSEENLKHTVDEMISGYRSMFN